MSPLAPSSSRHLYGDVASSAFQGYIGMHRRPAFSQIFHLVMVAKCKNCGTVAVVIGNKSCIWIEKWRAQNMFW